MKNEFRVWCKNKKEWEKDVVALLPNGCLIEIKTMRPLNMGTHIVEFYTDKTDKNGVEIFEGDIIKEDHGHFTSISKVGFHNLKWVTYFKDRFDEWCLGEDLKRMGNYEVIGNIHEEKG